MIEVLKQMVEALESATVDCSNFHHAKKDQNHHLGECPPVIRWHHAIQAGRQAIAELESQEPVARVVLTETLELPCLQWLDLNRQFDFKGGEYLYTHPPQRTEQEPVAWNLGVPPLYPQIKDGETISVEHLETTPQPQRTEQEPVAWADIGTRDVDNDAGLSWTHGHFHTTPLYTHPPKSFTYEQVKAHIRAASMSANDIVVGSDVTNDGVSIVIRRRDEILYAEFFTHPPQRTWVGLTDEEVKNYWDWEDFQCGCGRRTLLAMVRNIEAKLKELNS